MASNTPDRGELAHLATLWSNTNTTLWVVAAQSATIRAVLPEVSITSTRVATDAHLIEQTLLRRPSKYTTETFSLALARVPLD